MEREPLVSVLIPAYCHEKYIQEAIHSVINQTYKRIELIVIDDGSSDSTWQKMQEIKRECEERFERVYFETKKNEGVCKTLNKLLMYSKGEFLLFVASDDRVKPEAIEKEISFLINHPEFSLVVGDSEIIDSEGTTCYWDKNREIVYDIREARSTTFVEFLKRQNNYFNDRDFGRYETLLRQNYIPNGGLVRKSIYDIIGFYPDGLILEDFWSVLQISKYTRMKYLNEILYSYRWHNSNTIKNSEKMRIAGENTLALEFEIQKSIDRSLVLDGVLEVIDNGFLSKKRGIPFLFEILTFRKANQKIKYIKIFDFTVFKFTVHSK